MQAFIIPDKILNEINRILFRFVWKKRNNNKKAFEKVKRTILCSDYKVGGLKMIDIKQMQLAFTLHMVTRLTTHSSTEKSIEIAKKILSPHGKNFECFHSNVRSKFFKGMDEIKSEFWSEVLRIWLDNNHVTNGLEFNPMLWNNTNFVYGNNVIFFKDWAENGITSIDNVIEQNNILSYDEICRVIGHTARRVLEYNVVKVVVDRYLNSYNQNIVRTRNLNDPPHFHNKIVKDAKEIRNILTTLKNPQPCSTNFWKRKFDYNIGNCDWTLSFNTTKETRLRVLQ